MPYVILDKMLFLSEASKILSSSLDYNITLEVIARLLVSNVCDFCIIDIFKGHTLQRLSVTVSDPKKQNLALKVYDFKPDPKNKFAIYDAAKNSSAIIIKKATPSWLMKVSKIPEERKVIEKLGLNSHMFIPLKSRGSVIGVITLASTNPDFFYTPEDAIFLEELADRAGTAVDKARLYTEAQEALRTRDEFLSIASHELKTPLTSILLNLQDVLRKIRLTKSDIPEVNELVKMVEVSINQSYRMSRLINDLLNVSVAATDRLQIEKDKVDLVPLIKGVISGFRVKLREYGVKVKFEHKDRVVIGKWDKIRIEQVVANLLSNAIKYGNKKPIKITLSSTAESAIIKIIDQGIGIKSADQTIIFERFKRAVSHKDYSGLGVGLYISKQIIEAHKGTLKIESTQGKGAVFSIILPRN